MRTGYLRILGGIAGIALTIGLAGVSQAHHSFAAEFDAAKTIAVDGVVTKVRIVNPHSWIYLDVKNKDGSVTNWGFEFGTPSTLEAKGVTKDDVRPGTHVKIEGYLARNGGAFGYSRVATLANGRAVQTGQTFGVALAAGPR
jgi:hypothetical protein